MIELAKPKPKTNQNQKKKKTKTKTKTKIKTKTRTRTKTKTKPNALPLPTKWILQRLLYLLPYFPRKVGQYKEYPLAKPCLAIYLC